MTSDGIGVVVAVTIAMFAGIGPATSDAADLPARTRAESWRAELRTVDGALVTHDSRAARRALSLAYHRALGSRGWEGMVAVGDASRRVGALTGERQVARQQARRAYLEAFVRAREQRSLDGVLRAAQGFESLGDWPVVVQALRAADGLAVSAEERERVRAVSARLPRRPSSRA